MLKRTLPLFGITLVWNGSNRVEVMNKERKLYELRLKGRGLRTACEAMQKEEEALHRACQM